MSVEDLGVVDLISVDKAGNVVLTITDHLDWIDSIQHQLILQKKFNAYLALVESGEIFDRYPGAKGRAVVFDVVFRFRPDLDGFKFLLRAKEVIESASISLRSEAFAESYDN